MYLFSNGKVHLHCVGPNKKNVKTKVHTLSIHHFRVKIAYWIDSWQNAAEAKWYVDIWYMIIHKTIWLTCLVMNRYIMSCQYLLGWTFETAAWAIVCFFPFMNCCYMVGKRKLLCKTWITNPAFVSFYFLMNSQNMFFQASFYVGAVITNWTFIGSLVLMNRSGMSTQQFFLWKF